MIAPGRSARMVAVIRRQPFGLDGRLAGGRSQVTTDNRLHLHHQYRQDAHQAAPNAESSRRSPVFRHEYLRYGSVQRLLLR